MGQLMRSLNALLLYVSLLVCSSPRQLLKKHGCWNSYNSGALVALICGLNKVLSSIQRCYDAVGQQQFVSQGIEIYGQRLRGQIHTLSIALC